MESKVQNSSYMTQDANVAFVPFTTFRDVFGVTRIERIIIKAANTGDTPRMIEKVYEVFADRMGFDPTDRDAVWNWDTSEGARFFLIFFIIFEAFLLVAGMFTMFVGGIGVANIMYVAIRERRREIGIKAALGATPRLILAQFLLETFMIMFLGGLCGVAVAWIIVSLINLPAFSELQVVIGHPEINMMVSLITAGVLALIGFAAGWSPAKAAADMDPVQALEF
jgi:putative ABC transport system permease protein